MNEKKAGRNNKFKTNVEPYIDKIVEWVQQGATNKEIAENLDLNISTFQRYLQLGREGKEGYKEFYEAYTQAGINANAEVKAALFKSCTGFEYVETTIEQKINNVTGEIVALTKQIHKTVPPSPASIMFWLANKDKEGWSYHPENNVDKSESDNNTGVVMLPEIIELDNDSGEGAASV